MRARDLPQAGAALVINDYWRVAIGEGADWVHLGQADLDRADVGAMRKACGKLGPSTHDEAEFDRALKLKPDYVALGPNIPPASRRWRLGRRAWSGSGMETARRRIPLVAIGGLNIERATLP